MKEYLATSIFYEKEYQELPIFDASQGVGFECEIDAEKRKFLYLEKKRIVEFRIHTWVGYSGNAVHFYGKLRVNDLFYKSKQNKICWSSNSPEITKGFEINIRRVLTQKEIDEAPKRYEYYDAGDYITGFLTKKELIEAGKKIFAEKFVGNWNLKIIK